MNMTAVKLEFEEISAKDGGIPVIIVAAGSSTRMQGTDKQLLSLAGVPVIIRTLRAFERSTAVSRIILVTKKESIPKIQLLCGEYMITKLSDIVEGGADRHASVRNGLERLAPQEDRVLIHDGARPFVTEKMISECAAALDEFDGSLCTVKINDTVKSVKDDGCVEVTLDRTRLFSAQTPQGVRVSAYKAAMESAPAGTVFTDDASVLEQGGYRVKAVAGDVRNIKITTPADILLAQAILEGEDLC